MNWLPDYLKNTAGLMSIELDESVDCFGFFKQAAAGSKIKQPRRYPYAGHSPWHKPSLMSLARRNAPKWAYLIL